MTDSKKYILKQVPLNKFIPYAVNDNKPMTEDRIRNAYQISAKLVELYGDVYLPIFERMHKEVELLSQKRGMKELALSVAKFKK